LWKPSAACWNTTPVLDAVEEGRAPARRGELLEHDEVVARIEGMFQS